MLLDLKRWLLLVALTSTNSFAVDVDQTNIRIYGEILGPSCQVKQEDLYVEFGTLTNKDLIWHGQSISQDFNIEFECETADSYDVAITFTGQETFYSDLQRLIIINGDTPSNPWGVAIQLTDTNGRSIPINAETETYQIKDNSILNFKAYVKASQNAINNKNIRLGEFESVANFLVEYQ